MTENEYLTGKLKEVNESCTWMVAHVQQQTIDLLNKGKKVGLVGGDHSTPLGFIKALATLHSNFGVLQVDAHADLREAYENFTYSHA
ncbi:MAG: arginase family protein, partial [Taibaiella sp.]|nr:arginase family protein [Taibaiella sp.]